MSNGTSEDAPSSPLVRQLKQKFDRMSATHLNTEDGRTHPPTHAASTKIHRVGNEEDDHVAYPILPVCCFFDPC